MKIEKYTKLKGNKYEVKIDGEAIKLYDDVIIKYELLRKKEIDDDYYKELVLYNDHLDAYYKGLKYITKKMRTEKEITKYLLNDYDKDIVLDTIFKLKKEGYINDYLYIKSYISDQILLGKMGPNKIVKELVKLGCLDEDVRLELEKIDDDVWLDKIEKIINKKVRINHSYGVNKLKDKIIYELENAGYYKWMIDTKINEVDFNDMDDLLEKEYCKIFNKLGRKYEGIELENKIISRLINKGFRYEDIKRILDN